MAASVALAGSVWAGAALAAVSDLDLSFDGDGFVRNNLLGSAGAADVIVQADGKIVAVGTSDVGGSENAILVRYSAAGVPDTTFDGDGEFQAGYGTDDAVLRAAAIRPTGQIVTAGYTDDTIDLGVIAQHTATGALDTAGFASANGFDSSAFNAVIDGSSNQMRDVALAANGDAVAVGEAEETNGGPVNFALFSLTSTGAPRNPFGGGSTGETSTNVSNFFGTPNPGGDDVANAVAIEPGTGDILVVGTADPTVGAGTDDDDVAVVRYTSAGNRDTASGFGGGDAIATLDIEDSDFGNDLAIQPDGKILITGNTGNGAVPNDHFVARLNANGTPDTSFGDGTDGVFVQSAIGGINFGNALTLLPSGKLVAVGVHVTSQDWVVARYTAAGAPDTSFDGDGSRVYAFDPDSAGLEAVAAQADGKLIVGGDLGADLAIGRLEADPVPPVEQGATNPPPAAKKKKCKKGRKLKKGKCVKKKRKRRR